MDKVKYKTISIYKAMENIKEDRIILPSIQRKFIWDHVRVEDLFDSLMRGYPIGTFLFWEIEGRKHMRAYVFYKFIHNIEKGSNWNEKIQKFPHSSIQSVLDGQQRLTALYSAFHGIFKYKTPYKKWSSKDAFPDRFLCINILYIKNEDGDDRHFQFQYKTEQEIEIINEKNLWFKVNLMAEINQPDDCWDYSVEYVEQILNQHNDEKILNIIEGNKKLIYSTINKLYNRTMNAEITYASIKSPDLDEVLDIFVRVNSGGIILSKTDLLFSTITAKWEKARDEIDDIIQACESRGYVFNTDFIMRSCLVLTESPILFKVKGFSKKNVLNIMEEWRAIKKAIKDTTELLIEWNIHNEILRSKNALIPILYFLYKKSGKVTVNDKKELKKYIIHAQLKNIFGTHGDAVLSDIRLALRRKMPDGTYGLQNNNFLLKDLMKQKKFGHNGNYSLALTQDDLDEWCEEKKGSSTFMVLSLLYPYSKFIGEDMHQDHIHPNSGFDTEKLSCLKLTENQIWDMQWKKDRLPNLQFLKGSENIRKQDTPFNIWLKREYKTREDRNEYLSKNYIPDTSLEFSDFFTFYNTREQLLKDTLRKALEFSD